MEQIIPIAIGMLLSILAGLIVVVIEHSIYKK